MENSARWSLDILAAEPMLSQRLRVDRRAAAKQISPGCRLCLGTGRVASPRRPVLRSGRKFRATNADGPLGDRTLPPPVTQIQKHYRRLLAIYKIGPSAVEPLPRPF